MVDLLGEVQRSERILGAFTENHRPFGVFFRLLLKRANLVGRVFTTIYKMISLFGKLEEFFFLSLLKKNRTWSLVKSEILYPYRPYDSS